MISVYGMVFFQSQHVLSYVKTPHQWQHWERGGECVCVCVSGVGEVGLDCVCNRHVSIQQRSEMGTAEAWRRQCSMGDRQGSRWPCWMKCSAVSWVAGKAGNINSLSHNSISQIPFPSLLSVPLIQVKLGNEVRSRHFAWQFLIPSV